MSGITFVCQPATHKTTVQFSDNTYVSFETVGKPNEDIVIRKLWNMAVANSIKPKFINDYITEELLK